MAQMGKLSVILLEDHVDAVIRSLGEVGAAQFVNMRERLYVGKVPLFPYEVPSAIESRCSDLLSRIDTSIKALKLKRSGSSSATAPSTDERIENVLSTVEKKLAELPVEPLAKSLALLERIEELAGLYEVTIGDEKAGEGVLQKSVEEVLSEIEAKLFSESLVKLPTLLIKIDELAERLGIEIRDVSVDKGILERPEDEIIAQIERELSETERTAATSGLTDRKALTSKVEALTLEERTELGRRLMEVRGPLENLRTTLGEKLSRSKKLAETLKQSSETQLKENLQTYRRLAKTVKNSIEAKKKPEQILRDLLVLEDMVKRERKVAEVEGMLGRTAKTVYFEAWVPDGNEEEVVTAIKKKTDECCVIEEEPISHGEKEPIVLKPVPSFIRAFEKLTFASGYPSAHEVNPTLLMAITFPILFGIMFADVGQGAIFVVLGLLLTYFRRKVIVEEAGDISRYLLLSGEMFVLLGLLSMFWGFVFGEFFGPSEVLHPMELGRIGPFYFGGYEPTHEPMKMIRFAILVGAIHVSLGLVLKFVNTLREREYKHAPIPVSWLWLLWGGLLMWAYWGGISSISRWFSEGLLMMIGLIITPLALLVVFTGIVEGFMEGIGFGVEVFAETLSHTLSYGRLMALGLVHSVMNYLFLVLGGVKHGHFPLMSIPIVATGTILVMIIEGLIVFVHTLRLHWIEWFSKFYSGEGIPFKPFKFT